VGFSVASESSTLARLYVRVSTGRSGWRDHFLLVSGIRVRDLRVNVLIPDRRRLDHALMLDERRGLLVPIVCPRWIVALGNGLFDSFGHTSW
jgi:hypothetical protein